MHSVIIGTFSGIASSLLYFSIVNGYIPNFVIFGTLLAIGVHLAFYTIVYFINNSRALNLETCVCPVGPIDYSSSLEKLCPSPARRPHPIFSSPINLSPVASTEQPSIPSSSTEKSSVQLLPVTGNNLESILKIVTLINNVLPKVTESINKINEAKSKESDGDASADIAKSASDFMKVAVPAFFESLEKS